MDLFGGTYLIYDLKSKKKEKTKKQKDERKRIKEKKYRKAFLSSELGSFFSFANTKSQ